MLVFPYSSDAGGAAFRSESTTRGGNALDTLDTLVGMDDVSNGNSEAAKFDAGIDSGAAEQAPFSQPANCGCWLWLPLNSRPRIPEPTAFSAQLLHGGATFNGC